MIGNCCNDSANRCKVVVVVGVLPVLFAAGAVYVLVKLVWGIGRNLAMPSAGWIPLLMLAAAGTLWGLWVLLLHPFRSARCAHRSGGGGVECHRLRRVRRFDWSRDCGSGVRMRFMQLARLDPGGDCRAKCGSR